MDASKLVFYSQMVELISAIASLLTVSVLYDYDERHDYKYSNIVDVVTCIEIALLVLSGLGSMLGLIMIGSSSAY